MAPPSAVLQLLNGSGYQQALGQNPYYAPQSFQYTLPTSSSSWMPWVSQPMHAAAQSSSHRNPQSEEMGALDTEIPCIQWAISLIFNLSHGSLSSSQGIPLSCSCALVQASGSSTSMPGRIPTAPWQHTQQASS